MRQKTLFVSAVFLGALLLTTGCTKETANEMNGIPEDAVMLTTEGFQNNEKTSVSNMSVQWTGVDESIRFYVGDAGDNEQTSSVTVSGDNAYVSGISGSGAIRGYYPVSIITDDDASDNVTAPTVVVPNSYDSRYTGGRQVLALPMVASASNGAEEIEFKHVTAAVKVLVKNETGFDLTLDKVVVSSSAYKLCGTVVTTLADNNLGITPQAGSGSVTVRFTDAPTITTGGEDIKEIQVPILPIGESQLTIEVYAHSKVGTVLGIEGLSNANYDFHYNCTPEGNTPALGRNIMATARIALKRTANTVSPATMTEIDHSLFTVENLGGGNYRKVRFSKGNLQYIGSAATPYWKFADHQWDYFGTTTGQNSSASNVDRDLFGWGTSGHYYSSGYGSAYQPWSTSTTDADYGPTGSYNLTDDYSYGDWGIENTITNATGMWQTLTMNDWYYLLRTRPSSTINGTENARYTEAQINTDGTSIKGLIIFPDNYTAGTPEGVTWGTINNYSTWGTRCTTAGWASLEAAGCVFLPAAGYRDGISIKTIGTAGGYWSSSRDNNDKSYCIRFIDNNFYPNYSRTRHTGSSVRLVQNAN